MTVGQKSLSELFELIPALEKKAAAIKDPLSERRKSYTKILDRHIGVIESIINKTVSEDAVFRGKSSKFVVKDTKGYRYIPYYGKTRLKIGPDDKDYDILAPDLKSLKKKLDEYRGLVVAGHGEINEALLKKQADLDKANAKGKKTDRVNSDEKKEESGATEAITETAKTRPKKTTT